MLLDPGPLGLHSAIAAIIWKPSIDAIAEPFLSAITAMVPTGFYTNCEVAIIWKAGFRPLFKDQQEDATTVFSAANFNDIRLFSPETKLPSLTLTGTISFLLSFSL